MTRRDRLTIAVVLLALLVAGSWFFVLSPQREEAAQLSGDVATQREQLDRAIGDVAAGLAAKRGYAHAYATVARLGTAVPADDDVASLVVQVQSAATSAHVDFRSLKVGQGSGASAAPPPAPTPAPSSPSTAAPASPATGAPGAAPASQAATATLPPGAAVGAAGFPTMPFSFQFDGSFFQMSAFLGRLERFLVVRNRAVSVSGRFMTLDGIAIGAAPKGFPRVQAAIAATTYLLPATEGLTNGATPDGPASATPAAGGSTTSSGGGTTPPTATATSAVR